MTVFTVTVCAACGEAVFPPRALCPPCGGREWRTVEAGAGTVEETTERDGVRIASVRTDVGPIRLGHLKPGSTRELTTAEIGELFAAVGL